MISYTCTLTEKFEISLSSITSEHSTFQIYNLNLCLQILLNHHVMQQIYSSGRSMTLGSLSAT
jgi:hypothetical protein